MPTLIGYTLGMKAGDKGWAEQEVCGQARPMPRPSERPRLRAA